MTVKASKFTPEVMLSAPRRSAGVPNESGWMILYTESTYSFSEQETKSEFRCLDIKSGESHLLDDSGKVSNPAWVDLDTVAALKSIEESPESSSSKSSTPKKTVTQLLVGPVLDFQKSCYVAGTIDAPASDLKIAKLGHKHFGVAFSAAANPDGSLHVAEPANEKKSTGRLYRSTWVRHWDKWLQRSRNSLWYAALYATKSSSSDQPTSYALSTITNALKGTALESPIAPFGGVDHFDISKRGIVFVAKDPALNPALNTKCNIYFVPLTNFLETTPTIYSVDMGYFQGAMTSPQFSKDGSKVAFLVMKENGYEADRNHICIMTDVTRPAWITQPLGQDKWKISPAKIRWDANGSTLFLTADKSGAHRVFTYDTSSCSNAKITPQDVSVFFGSVADVQTLSHGDLFISTTSLVDSSCYQRFSLGPHARRVTSSATNEGETYGLSAKQVDEFWFRGESDGQLVHAIMMKPSKFQRDKKYPLAFLVHGGPQGAWNNAWSTRWNLALWAEAGYVVVAPNPTGSTGYGQPFVDAIKQQWGGLPYKDLERCFAEIKDRFQFVDADRAVALGASYGGFSMNWINGHPLGKKFKCLVTHDGIFSTRFALATEELYFPNHDLGGPWLPSCKRSREEWDKWDPSLHTDNWTTPNLVIHSANDYRLSEAEGLATFNMLQQRGIESEFLSFPDENHFVLKPENSLVWHKAVFNWINRHVGLPVDSYELPEHVIQDPPRPSYGNKGESNKVVALKRE